MNGLKRKYRIDIENYRIWYQLNTNGAFMFSDDSLVYIDSDYASVHHGEDCVSVHEVDGVICVSAIPRRFLIPTEA